MTCPLRESTAIHSSWTPVSKVPRRRPLFSSPRDEHPNSDATPSGSPTGKGVGTLRVLIVEDSVDAAQTLQELLQSIGYVVFVANTGPEGLQAALQLRPHVLLCDIGLPGLDGYQIAIRLKQQPASSSTRLIAVTGYGGAEDRRRAEAAGFDHHLTKPVDLDELERLLAAEAALLRRDASGDEPAAK
jgi:CheY-like chemotaxis protein